MYRGDLSDDGSDKGSPASCTAELSSFSTIVVSRRLPGLAIPLDGAHAAALPKQAVTIVSHLRRSDTMVAMFQRAPRGRVTREVYASNTAGGRANEVVQ